MSALRVNHRELLEFVEGILYGTITATPAEVTQRLQPCKNVFLNLLNYPGPSADARQQVVGGYPLTPRGHIRLDANDIQETILLSDELQLDELLALQCLVTGHDERGEVAAEVGAGIYFEERRGLAGSLHRLLQAQVVGVEEGVSPAVLAAVCASNEDLLSQQSNGRSVLVHRIITLLKDTSLEPAAGSRLPKVVDERGSEVDRRTLVQAERILLCECLLYCCRIQQRQAPADIADMIDLLHGLALRARSRQHPPGGDPGHQVAFQQAYMVLLAVVSTLLSRSLSASATDERDDSALGKLALDPTLASRFEGSAVPEDGFQAVGRLAWGLLLAQHGPANTRERAAICIKQACEVGVLHWLHTSVLESTPFLDDLPFQKEIYAQIIGQLLISFLDAEPGRDEVGALMTESKNRAEAKRTGQAVEETGKDSLASLLSAFAAVLRTFPDFVLDENIRDPVLGQFVEYIARSGLLAEAPPTFVAFVDMLTAVASGPQGARDMFRQLRPGNTYDIISWNCMFEVMRQYCLRYLPQRENVEGGVQARAEQLLVPQEDAQAMAAYLRLFARVFEEGDPTEVVAWRHALEEETGVGAPLWEVMYQLMAHPVPQNLKAALHQAIASFAVSPEVAIQLLERLLQAAVVSPAPVLGLPRYDLTYQLNEIEARAEDYQETLAFVRLLNSLLRAARPLLPDEGRPYIHFTEFVRTDVLGCLHQRAFKSQKQKWELAAACFEHLQLALRGMRRPVSALPASADAPNMATPGLLVMLDLLGERAACRAAFGLVIAGVETAAAERRDEAWGGAREDALLAALRLIRLALARDQDLVAALRKSVQTGQYEPLEVVIKSDKRRLPALLDYVRCSDSPAVQAEAIRITAALAGRMGNMVDLLLQPPARGQAAPAARISSGFGTCLWDSLFAQGAFVAATEEEDDSMGGDGEGTDVRASLILNLLLQAVDYPAPNLTHLLLGFNVAEGPQGVATSMLDSRAPPTCLGPVLKGAESAHLPGIKPELYEQLLDLLHLLASAPLTTEPVLALLRAWQLVVNQLEVVTCAPLPTEGRARAASLHQRASLLQLGALDLLRSDPAVPSHRDSCLAFLSAFFVPPVSDTGGEMDEGQRVGRVSDIVDLLAYPLTEPQLSSEAGVDVRRLQQRLGIDTLLASPTRVEEGGVRTLSAHSDNCYDVNALARILRQRYVEEEQDSRRYPGGPMANGNQELREACRAAIRFAQKYNAVVQEAGGQVAAMRAWQAVVEIGFAHRYELLAQVARELPGGAVSILQDTLQDVLEVLPHILPAEGLRLAPLLCQVIRTLLMRLQEQAALQLGLPSDPAPTIRLPSRCHELLLKLLALLREGRASEGVRLPLYGALLNYLQLCRPPPLARVPAHVLEALLQGLRVAVEAGSAQLSSLEGELEAGNAAVLSSYPHLIDLVAKDAVGPSSNKVAKALALSLFGALLASGSGAEFAEAVNRTGVPNSILQDLVDTAHEQLLQVPPKARAALAVQEAQLALLLRLGWAGLKIEASAASNRLSAVNTINMLAQCRAVDLAPEEPGPRASGTQTLRGRLAKFNAAVLRVVNAILAALPESKVVRLAAAEFVAQHQAALLRILSEAASSGTQGWEPGNTEFAQASLVLTLLVNTLAEGPQSGGEPGPMRTAVYKLLQRHAGLDNEGEGSSLARFPGTLSTVSLQRDEHLGHRSRVQVWGLRAALASYLRRLMSDSRRGLVLELESKHFGEGMWVPCLATVRDMLCQGTDDLVSLLDVERRLLGELRSSSRAIVGDSGVGRAGELFERASLARQAAEVEREEDTLLRLIENCLAILGPQLKRLTSADDMKPRDLSVLRRPLVPVLDQLESLDPATLGKDRDLSSLKVLVRRVKDAFAS